MVFQVLWKYSGEIQPLKFLARDTVSIGQHISTKAIDLHEGNNLFNTYLQEKTMLCYRYKNVVIIFVYFNYR